MLGKASWYSIDVSGNDRHILLFYKKCHFCHLIPFAKLGQYWPSTWHFSRQFIMYSWVSTSLTKMHCPVSFQISRLLVVDPKRRLTASEALEHPFFQQLQLPVKAGFNAKRKLKVSIWRKKKTVFCNTEWPRKNRTGYCPQYVGCIN